MREAERFILAVETALDAHLDDPIAALTAAFGLFLSAAAEDQLIRAAIAGSGEMLPFVTTQGQPLVQGAAERLCAGDPRALAAGRARRRGAAGRVPGAAGDQLRRAARGSRRDDGRFDRAAARPLHRARATALNCQDACTHRRPRGTINE